jgi:hypothetical protein
MRPGSVAAAGAASGRPSHHHASATAAAVKKNKATSFRMAIPWGVTRAVSDLDNRKPLAIFVFDAFSRRKPSASREYSGRTDSIRAP